MMTSESMLSKRPVLRFTVVLFFLLKLFSSHIHCILSLFLYCHCFIIPEQNKARFFKISLYRKYQGNLKTKQGANS